MLAVMAWCEGGLMRHAGCLVGGVGGLQASLVAAGQPGTSVSAAMRLLLLVAAVARQSSKQQSFFQ